MNSVTTYPFNIMRNGWEKVTPSIEDLPLKGDTVGGDVFGLTERCYYARVHIGDGAIITANSVVTKDVLHIMLQEEIRRIIKR